MTREEAMKDALRVIRGECSSGYPEMAAVDEAWRNLFGDTADAPWKACLCWQGGRCPIHGANA